MTKFFGKVGFNTGTAQTAPGVWNDVIEERQYFGDVVTNNRRLETVSDKVNFDLATSNSISIVSDDFANEQIFAIRYVEWSGSLWVVQTVEVQRPRLLLHLGGVYHGPTPGTPNPS